MGAGRAMKSIIDRQKTTEEKAKYWDRRNESDKASELVGKGLGARAEFRGFDRDAFAREKRESARNRRATRRDERQARREERQDYYRQQMDERRRAHEMRKPKEEMGNVGVLGAPNPYGDDAIWDNKNRSWQPNTGTQRAKERAFVDYFPEKEEIFDVEGKGLPGYDITKEIWQRSQNNKPETARDMPMTNIFGQSRGVNLGPGSADRGAVNEQPQTGGDNRDFKKLYEELLKIHNAGKK